MLQIWFDDSGKGQLPVFVLAGYLARVPEWESFSDDWQKVLNKEPRLEYIKGYEAFGFRAQFKRWSEEERDRRLLKFVPLIESYSGKGLATVIDHEHFSKIIKQAPETPFRNPYTFAYSLALSIILSAVQENFAPEQVDIVFDRDIIKRKRAENAYKGLFKVSPNLAQLLARREPRFEDDKKFMPLQASDLLAHCIRAQHDRRSLYERVTKSPVFDALRSIPTGLVRVGDKEMQYLKDRVMREGTPQGSFAMVRW